jgi:hypothetical protein
VPLFYHPVIPNRKHKKRPGFYIRAFSVESDYGFFSLMIYVLPVLSGMAKRRARAAIVHTPAFIVAAAGPSRLVVFNEVR